MSIIGSNSKNSKNGEKSVNIRKSKKSEKLLILIGLVVFTGLLVKVVYRGINARMLKKNFTSSQHQQNLFQNSLGKEHHFVKLLDPSSGINLSSECKKRYCVVHFWASWCESCKNELLDLHDFKNLLRLIPVDIKVFSITYKDKVESSQELLKQLGLPSLNVYYGGESNETIEKVYGLTGVPETMFVEPGGRIYRHIRGPIHLNDMRKIVNKMIN